MKGACPVLQTRDTSRGGAPSRWADPAREHRSLAAGPSPGPGPSPPPSTEDPAVGPRHSLMIWPQADRPDLQNLFDLDIIGRGSRDAQLQVEGGGWGGPRSRSSHKMCTASLRAPATEPDLNSELSCGIARSLQDHERECTASGILGSNSRLQKLHTAITLNRLGCGAATCPGCNRHLQAHEPSALLKRSADPGASRGSPLTPDVPTLLGVVSDTLPRPAPKPIVPSGPASERVPAQMWAGPGADVRFRVARGIPRRPSVHRQSRAMNSDARASSADDKPNEPAGMRGGTNLAGYARTPSSLAPCHPTLALA